MKKKKTIVKFLLKFFITYSLLVLSYNFYLDSTQQRGSVFSCSPVTQTVAYHTQKLANFLGYNTTVYQHEAELSMKFYVGQIYAIRIVEGCNSVSVIILFLSFIIAFAGSLKATILYGLVGSFLIYSINIVRILVLSLLLYKFPEYRQFLHGLLFPAIIYGTVFLLWIIWVNKFSYLKKAKK